MVLLSPPLPFVWCSLVLCCFPLLGGAAFSSLLLGCVFFQKKTCLSKVVFLSVSVHFHHILVSLKLLLWLCDARECSTISAIVKPLSAHRVLLRKPARMSDPSSATVGILSALALLLINETSFLLSEYRQVLERQQLVHKNTSSNETCPEPEVADLDCEFPFLCGLGTGVLMTLALVVLSRYRCSSRAGPAALQARRVRLKRVNFAQSKICDRPVVSR